MNNAIKKSFDDHGRQNFFITESPKTLIIIVATTILGLKLGNIVQPSPYRPTNMVLAGFLISFLRIGKSAQSCSLMCYALALAKGLNQNAPPPDPPPKPPDPPPKPPPPEKPPERPLADDANEELSAVWIELPKLWPMVLANGWPKVAA